MLAIRQNKPSISLFENMLDELFSFPVEPLTRPMYDIMENYDEYIVDMQLAGIKKEDIKIDIEDNVLSIKAERKEIKEDKLKYNRKESFFGIYEKSFTLPKEADKENITASTADGILRLTIPKIKDETKLGKKIIEIK